jgi:hypothetical protein
MTIVSGIVAALLDPEPDNRPLVSLPHGICPGPLT